MKAKSVLNTALQFSHVLSVLILHLCCTGKADPLDIWALRNSDSSGRLNGIAGGDRALATVGEQTIGGLQHTLVLGSANGISWDGSLLPGAPANCVSFGNGRFVAVDAGAQAWTSTDAASWTSNDTGASGALNGVGYGNGNFVAVGDGGTILTSPDGVSWTPRAIAASDGFLYNLKAITYGGGLFLAVGDYPGTGGMLVVAMVASVDGVTWTPTGPVNQAGTLHAVAYKAGTFVSVGSSGTIFVRLDPTTWTRVSAGTTADLRGVAASDYWFVAVGSGGTIISSQDGASWGSRNSGVSADLFAISFGASSFVAVGDRKIIVQSGTINPLLVENTLDGISPVLSGSLRAAIEYVKNSTGPGPYTITFDPGLAGRMITLTAGQLQLSTGATSKTLFINGIPGGPQVRILSPQDRVLEIDPLWTVTISDLTITGQLRGRDGADGNIADVDGGDGESVQGGGIYNNGASLVLSNCLMSFCTATGGRGGEGFENVCPPSICEIGSYDYAGDGGKGGGGVGGAIYCEVGAGLHLELLGCTFSSNSAAGGNGGRAAAFSLPGYGPGREGGDGGSAGAGAVFIPYSVCQPVVAVNSTFWLNEAVAGQGGAGGAGGPGTDGGPGGSSGAALGGCIQHIPGICGEFALSSCTLYSNSASARAGGAGGPGDLPGANGSSGIARGGGIFSQNLMIQNSLIASNAVSGPSDGSSDLYAVINSHGYNLITSTVGMTGSGPTPTDLIGIDPRVDPHLRFNGGATPTIALLADSPAIDAGNSAIGLDQRLYGRPIDLDSHPNAFGGDGSDIGAFEVQPLSDGANSWTSSGSGKWEVASNWSAGAPGATSEVVLITNTGTKTVSIDSNTAAAFRGTLTVSNLIVSAPGVDQNMLAVNSGPEAPLHILGSLSLAGGSALNLSNSILQIDSLSPAASLLFDGLLSMNGSALFATNGAGEGIIVGATHSGMLAITNSQLMTHRLLVGSTCDGAANSVNSALDLTHLFMCNVSGQTGRVSVIGGNLIATNAASFIGDRGTALFIAAGATVRLSDVTVGNRGRDSLMSLQSGAMVLGRTYIGQNVGAGGAVLVSGGSMSLPEFHIGVQGTGSVHVTSGTVSANTLVQLGENATQPSALSISGGGVFITNASHSAALIVQNGSVLLTGGTLVVDKLILTNASARFTRVGGVLVYDQLILDPNLDADGDGISNGAEMAAGTDPLNPASVPAILSIARLGANVILTWPTGAVGFSLQQTINQGANVWGPVSPGPIIVGTSNVVTTPMVRTNKLLRLKR